jgi:hypothetical protein
MPLLWLTLLAIGGAPAVPERQEFPTRVSVSYRRLSAAAVVLFALIALLVGTVRAAAAEPVYVRIGSFGAAGSGPGELLGPHRLAVDEGSGDVLVADTAGGRVDVYRPTAAGAEYLFDFGEGSLLEPLGIAIDQASGDVYISDPGREQVFEFEPDDRSAPTAYSPVAGFTSPAQGTEEGEVGSFGEVRGFGAPTGAIAVDPTDGDLLLADPTRELVERYDPAGAFLSAFDGSGSGEAFTAPADIAVGPSGQILVADQIPGGARLLEFGSAGTFTGSFGPTSLPGSGLSGVAATFDPTAASVFAGSKTGLSSEAVRVGRFDSSAAAPSAEVEDEGAEGFLLGLAVSALPGPRLYVDASASAFGTGAVAVFEAIEPPAVTIEPPLVAGLAAGEARFAGTVDPGGVEVGECDFQYVDEADFEAEGFAGAESVPCLPPPGAGGSPEAVAASAAGLEPDTTYRVRLRATGAHGAAGISATAQFTTAPAPPVVASGEAWSISDTTATLTGSVDPENSPLTACRFEYGPTTSYGSSVPCSPSALSGGAPVAVVADVAGLAPSSAYHYRLLALGAVGGPQAGADRGLATRTSAESELPQRGYELVSAPDTNGVDPLPLVAGADGEGYVYATFIPAPGARSGLKSLFRATRAPDGSWSDSYVSTPAPPPGEDVGGNGGFLFSRDLSTSAFTTSQSLDPGDANHSGDAYLGDPGGSFTWASREPGVEGPETQAGNISSLAYISPDGSRVLFESPRHLLAADRSSGGHASLYEWDEGRLSLLGLLPGSQVGPETGSELGSSGENQRGTSYGAVSRDGSRVAFESEEEDLAEQLYLRLDRSQTIQVSKSAAGVEPVVSAPRQVTFWGADAEEHLIFFSSTSALTTDSASGGEEGEADLYAYDAEDGSLRDLTPNPGGGGVTRVYAVSEDGRRVYFTSTAALVPGQGVAGGSNLYLAELQGDGAPARPLRFLATVDPGEDQNSLGLDRPQAWREVASSPDGSLLAFRDRLALVPGRATGGRPQLYVYEAATGSLSCASCPGDGTEPGADADLLPALPAAGSEEPEVDAVQNLVANTAAPHLLDVSSGGAVFFQTANALVPSDTNGRIDVYEWHGGKVGLISAGAEAHDSIYGGASSDGASVFFSSADALVPGAQDGVRHIYAARVGGGAPPAPTAAPPCEGADCRAPQAAPGLAPAAGTALFSGPGDLIPVHHKPKKRKATRKKAAHARGKSRRARAARHGRHRRAGRRRDHRSQGRRGGAR